MRYRYRSDDELKDSGVEWIGKIPKDWEVKRIKHLFELKKDKSDEENPTVLSLTQKGLKIRDVSNNEGQLASTYVGYTKIEKNDFILNPMDLISGYTDKAEIEGVISPAYTTFRSKNKVNINHDYYKRYFQMHYHHNFLFPWGEGVSFEHRWTLKNEVFLNLPVITNTLEEQERIANFLDEKTSQFDLIISKKEKLIERLEEAKKSLISEVVTGKVKVVKNDDGYELIKRSSEEMKDSGVEWLGSIPKDWEVKKLKYIATINPPKSSVKKFVDKDIDVSFVPMDSVRLGNIKLDKTKKISEVIDGYTLFEDNDIVMAKVTPCFENRNIAICKGLTNKIGFGSSELNTIRVYENKDIKFMFYHLQEQKFMDTATYQMTGAGGLKRVPTSFLLNAQFTYPSDNEKERIVFYLENYIDKIDNISEKTKEQIEKLKEAKQSLISEAVTGKIEILD